MAQCPFYDGPHARASSHTNNDAVNRYANMCLMQIAVFCPRCFAAHLNHAAPASMLAHLAVSHDCTTLHVTCTPGLCAFATWRSAADASLDSTSQLRQSSQVMQSAQLYATAVLGCAWGVRPALYGPERVTSSCQASSGALLPCAPLSAFLARLQMTCFCATWRARSSMMLLSTPMTESTTPHSCVPSRLFCTMESVGSCGSRSTSTEESDMPTHSSRFCSLSRSGKRLCSSMAVKDTQSKGTHFPFRCGPYHCLATSLRMPCSSSCCVSTSLSSKHSMLLHTLLVMKSRGRPCC
mmetsp:Transcript_10228/g.21918  ORF Transcript_10228/g.21918 Transcript_10228/m.21918 type:complete len:295 (-) Transcript_10228:1042-1926(-)